MSDKQVLDIDITQDPTQNEPSQDTIEIPSEDTTASDDKSESSREETTTSDMQKKNKSNFKKLSDLNKEKDRRIAELESKLSEKPDEVEDDSVDDSTTDYDRVDFLEFITDTPWAWEIKNQIKEALDEYPWISFEKAFAYAKAQLPEESQSYKMFNTKSVNAPKKKKLTELTHEEAWTMKLSAEQYDTWANAQKKTVIPFN